MHGASREHAHNGSQGMAISHTLPIDNPIRSWELQMLLLRNLYNDFCHNDGGAGEETKQFVPSPGPISNEKPREHWLRLWRSASQRPRRESTFLLDEEAARGSSKNRKCPWSEGRIKIVEIHIGDNLTNENYYSNTFLYLYCPWVLNYLFPTGGVGQKFCAPENCLSLTMFHQLLELFVGAILAELLQRAQKGVRRRLLKRLIVINSIILCALSLLDNDCCMR